MEFSRFRLIESELLIDEAALIESAGMNFQRIAVTTLVAVPSTAALTAALLLVPPIAAFAIGISGLILFRVGPAINRPSLVGVGGVVMFAGVLSWALRQ